jgi:RNA 2',3'-cyclic 3'-phosphodiesterase
LEKIRTFLSLNIESTLIERLKAVQSRVKENLIDHKVKWEDPQKLHMTLRFLGDVDKEKINDMTFTLERLKPDFESIKFTTRSIGFFPNPRYPNVVFISMKEDGRNSSKLVEFIDKIIFNFGVKPEKRFVPHITLGRFRKDKRINIDKPVEINMEPIEIEFVSFYLMRSILTPEGSVYETISEFKFNK